MHDMTNFLTLSSHWHIVISEPQSTGSSAYDTWAKLWFSLLVVLCSALKPTIILWNFISLDHIVSYYGIKLKSRSDEESGRSGRRGEHCSPLWYKWSLRICYKSVLFRCNRFHIFIVGFNRIWIALIDKRTDLLFVNFCFGWINSQLFGALVCNCLNANQNFFRFKYSFLFIYLKRKTFDLKFLENNLMIWNSRHIS